MLTPEEANQILAFLAKTQISGGEAPVFMNVVMKLRQIAAPLANGHGAPADPPGP